MRELEEEKEKEGQEEQEENKEEKEGEELGRLESRRLVGLLLEKTEVKQ